MRRTFVFSSILVLTILLTPHRSAQAASSNAQFEQYLSELQNSPDDQELRKKIIQWVHSMKHKPATPDDFDRYMDRGGEAFKEAKSVGDYNDAVEEFKKATLAAPWMGNAYYNLGLAQEKAGDHAGAVRSFKLYLAVSPNGSDAKKVKSTINKIEYKAEKARKEKAQRLQTWEGKWSEWTMGNPAGSCLITKDPDSGSYKITVGSRSTYDLTVKEGHIHWEDANGMWDFDFDLSQDGMSATGVGNSPRQNIVNQAFELKRVVE